MDEPREPNGLGDDEQGLFLAEPVLASSPAAAPLRRTRSVHRIDVDAETALAPHVEMPSAVAPPAVAPPTPAEYFAAQEARVATAQHAFDPTRVVKGPTVVVAKRRRRRSPWVLGGAAVVAGAALGAFTFLGAGDPAATPLEPVVPASAESGTDGAEPVSEGPAAPAATDGAFGTLGGLEVDVVRVTDPFGYSLGPAPEGFRYVAVVMDVAYDGNDVVDVAAADALAVLDAQGRRWPLADAAFDGLGEPFPVLGPGVAATATAVFVVGDDATELSLVVTVPDEGGELVLPLS